MSKKGIILFGHGARNPEWAAPFHRVQAEMRLQMPAAEYGIAFLELMQPSLPEAVQDMVCCHVTDIAVVPLFISAGSHIREDLPRLAAEAMQAHPGLKVTIAAPLGDAPEMIAAMARYAIRQVEADQ